MKRILEPELMDEIENAKLYAAADFEAPHNQVIQMFLQKFPGFSRTVQQNAIDLGCGPADISIRFAKALPLLNITAIDGAKAMLDVGREYIEQAHLGDRITLVQGYLPCPLPKPGAYDLIFSNSLLHHLPEPEVIWQSIQQAAHPGSHVFITDLLRPESKEKARQLVETYSRDEPELLKEDFYYSLLAAFSADEVKAQIRAAGLSQNLQLEVTSDRHLMVFGTM